MASEQSVISHRIFAYGTLKSGQPNHFHLKDQEHGRCRLIGRAVTEELYPLVIATRWNLPFLVNASGIGNHVIGEVYEVDDDLMEWMDYFEDHPDVYERTKIIVNLLPASSDISINDSTRSTNQQSGSNKSNKTADNGNRTASTSLSDRNLTQTGANPPSNQRATNSGSGHHKLAKNVEKQARSKLEASKVGATPIECWCYLLHKFPDSLLQKEMYETYDSQSTHNRQYKAEEDDSGPDNIAEALLRESSASS